MAVGVASPWHRQAARGQRHRPSGPVLWLEPSGLGCWRVRVNDRGSAAKENNSEACHTGQGVCLFLKFPDLSSYISKTTLEIASTLTQRCSFGPAACCVCMEHTGLAHHAAGSQKLLQPSLGDAVGTPNSHVRLPAPLRMRLSPSGTTPPWHVHRQVCLPFRARFSFPPCLLHLDTAVPQQ